MTRHHPMRVAAVVEQFWHRVPGGTGRASRETLAELGRLSGISVLPVAGWHRTRHRGRADPLGPVAFAPLWRPALYESWIRLGRPTIERWVGPVDVAWSPSMVPMASRAPLVTTVHDLGFLDNPERNSRRGRSFFPRAWRAAVDRSAMLVCPSQVVADDCRRHGVAADRLRVVPWGVAPEPCTDDDADAVRRRLGLPPEFVLWVGTLEPRKNLGRLVEAIAGLDEVELALVGPTGWQVDGDDVLGPLGSRAHRLGALDDHDLRCLYRAATVFAFPSLVEGFGLPVLEAMAQDTPVVTSAGTATEEVAGGAAVLVEPTDVDDIRRGVSSVLERDATTLDLVTRGRERVSALTWGSTAKGYESVFREVGTR